MGQKSGPAKELAEQVIREIRRSTRRQFSAEEKIRIVLSGLRGEDSIAERVSSATTSFNALASRRSALTSSEVAARAVSPARRFLPASRNSFDQR